MTSRQFMTHSYGVAPVETLWQALCHSVLLARVDRLYWLTLKLCARIPELTSPIAQCAEASAPVTGRNLLLWSEHASVVPSQRRKDS